MAHGFSLAWLHLPLTFGDEITLLRIPRPPGWAADCPAFEVLLAGSIDIRQPDYPLMKLKVALRLLFEGVGRCSRDRLMALSFCCASARFLGFRSRTRQAWRVRSPPLLLLLLLLLVIRSCFGILFFDLQGRRFPADGLDGLVDILRMPANLTRRGIVAGAGGLDDGLDIAEDVLRAASIRRSRTPAIWSARGRPRRCRRRTHWVFKTRSASWRSEPAGTRDD